MLRNKRKAALKRPIEVEEKSEEQVVIKQAKSTDTLEKEVPKDSSKDILFTQSDLDSGHSDNEIDLQFSDSDEERDIVDIFEARIKSKQEVVEKRVPVYQDSDDDDDDDSFAQQEFNRVFNQKAKKWAEKTNKAEKDLSETSNLISKKEKILSSTNLDIVKLIDVNNEDKSARRLTICEFNPMLRAALTASRDTRFHLFAVDGKTNEKILSSKFEQFTPSAAHFIDGGKQILFTSNMKQMYVMNLFSDNKNANNSNTYDIKQFSIRGIDDTRFPIFKVSPNNVHIIFLSRGGQMHVVHQKTKKFIKTIATDGSRVEDVCFYDNGNMMMSFGDNGNIFTWDLRKLQCTGKYFNADIINGTKMACTRDGTKFACGTKSGCVDLFQFTSANISGCKKLKTFKNLRTRITQLKFSNSGEILAMASSETLEGIKLAHVANQSVFPNFPLIQRKGEIGNVISLDFSPNDGYLMIGNNKGAALLYRLNYYTGY